MEEHLSCADYSPTYKIVLKADAESASPPVCEFSFYADDSVMPEV